MPDSLLHIDFFEAALGSVVVTSLCLLGLSRQIMRIRVLALQGIVLGLIPVLALSSASLDLHIIAISCIFVVIKGIALPYLLYRTHSRLAWQQPAAPYISYTACVLGGVCAFIASLWLNSKLGVPANPLFNDVFPAAFTAIATGLLLIVTRKKALTQVLGYLVLENGIYLLGVPIMQAEAIWIELTILLDILVGVFVMGIAVYHIHQEFASTNVAQFSLLRD